MKNLILASLLFIASLAAAVGNDTTVPAKSSPDDTGIDTKFENELVQKHPKKFIRAKDILTIVVAKNKKKTFKDINNEKSGSFLKSLIVDYNEKHDVAVVEQMFYEGGQFLVVSLKDGKEIKVPTKPVWSPDKNNFIATNDDESDYTDNKVVIGTCKAKTCAQIFTENTHAGEAKWVDALTAEFEKRNFDPGTGVSDAKNFTCKIDVKKNKALCSAKK